MFEGKINAALQLPSKGGKRGILWANDTIDLGDGGSTSVRDILRSKHLAAQPVSPTALLEGNADPPAVPLVIFDEITANYIRHASLRTKGAAGPSGIDAHG